VYVKSHWLAAHMEREGGFIPTNIEISRIREQLLVFELRILRANKSTTAV